MTGGALAVIGSAVIVTLGHASSWWLELYAFVGLFSVFFAVFVWLVIPQQPRNAVVWAMRASAFCGGLEVAGLSGAALVVDDPSEILLGPELIVPPIYRRWPGS